jgi:hypothetical protein
MAITTMTFAKNEELIIINYLNGYIADELTTSAPFTKNGKTFSPAPPVDLLEATDAFAVSIDDADFIEDVSGAKFYLISGSRPVNIRKR